MKKDLATEMLMYIRQVKSSKSLRLNFYVVLQPATLPNMNDFKAIPHRFDH